MATKKNTGAKPVGRPSKFTQELADKICTLTVDDSLSMRKLCARDDMPNISTLRDWLSKNETFSAQYAHARQEMLLERADELEDIGDQASNAKSAVEVAGLRLKSDNRKWLLSKLLPKVFGDKVTQDVNHSGHVATTDVPLEEYKAARAQVISEY